MGGFAGHLWRGSTLQQPHVSTACGTAGPGPLWAHRQPQPPSGTIQRPTACLSGPRACRGVDAGELQDRTRQRKTGHVETCRPGRSRLRAPAAALRTKTSVPGRAQNTAFGMARDLGGFPRPPPWTAVPEDGHTRNPIPTEYMCNLWLSQTGCHLSSCPGRSTLGLDLGIKVLQR